MKRVYLAVINDLVTDQRLHRMADLLIRHGLDVTCIGRRLKGSPEPDDVLFKYRRYRMVFTRGPLFYACFNMRLFFTLLFVRKPSLIIANDLDTLPASFTVSRIRRVMLIYDSHEFFTQVPELVDRKKVQAIWKWIEYWFVRRLQVAVTVNQSIAEIYRRLYKIPFRVVRNVPYRREPCPDVRIREQFAGKNIVIYQGALNVGRGLELVIETMQYLENSVFVVVGTGDIDGRLRALVNEIDVADRVVFKGRLPPRELFPLTCAADIGISLEEDLGLNYRYALPNKLFDYIQARVPVLCSDLPEMSRIVRTYGVGIATQERDPQKLARIMLYMFEEQSKGAWKEALEAAAETMCWENESNVFLDLVRECGVIK